MIGQNVYLIFICVLCSCQCCIASKTLSKYLFEIVLVVNYSFKCKETLELSLGKCFLSGIPYGLELFADVKNIISVCLVLQENLNGI